MHPVLADLHPIATQFVPGFAIASATFLLGKRLQLGFEWGVPIGAWLVLKRRAIEVQILTGSPLGQTPLAQKGKDGLPLGFVGYFFARYSWRVSITRSRSARRRLRRVFSFANSLSRWASETVIPP